ncbi:Ger(x)C family spore germination protein [Pseudalkalibacillus sp. SCS-8]|uniref:Ger(x)C family spore germination protein n=1 Tax=Pseudalkalibacillus nanhaiensis TaxID=3115291 RepID=UPI0032D9EDC0
MKKFLFGILLPLLLLTGCWDQHLIKDARLVYAAALDRTENGHVRGTVIIRGFVASGAESGGGSPQNEIVSGVGKNMRETRMNIDKKLSDSFTGAKTRVYLYSEVIGEEGLYPYLDIFYREPSSSLNGKIAITNGEAAKYLEIIRKGNTLVAEYIEELIISSEKNSILPRLDVQAILSKFMDPGSDPVLPYLVLHEEVPEIEVKGLALFNDDRMTGFINTNDATLLLTLMNKTNKFLRFSRKVHVDKRQDIENYITIDVYKSKSDMTLNNVSNHSFTVDFDVNLKANIIEYPSDNLGSKKEFKKLEGKLSTMLTKEMNQMIRQLQDANSDPLGIGRELMAFHPKVWKNLEWEKDYPNIPINAKVTVEITGNGILN